MSIGCVLHDYLPDDDLAAPTIAVMVSNINEISPGFDKGIKNLVALINRCTPTPLFVKGHTETTFTQQLLVHAVYLALAPAATSMTAPVM